MKRTITPPMGTDMREYLRSLCRDPRALQHSGAASLSDKWQPAEESSDTPTWRPPCK